MGGGQGERTAVRFQRQHDFDYGVAEAVAPSLVRITARNPSAMTFHGTGTYVLGDGAVVIDPGPPLDDHLAVLLDHLEGGRPQHLLVTHHHHDHAGLAGALSRHAGVAISAHGHPGARRAGNGEEVPAAYYHTDIPLVDGDVVEAGELRLRVVHTPGHTSDHLCFVDETHRRVFCGDHVMGWSTSVIVPPDGDLGHYLASLERLLDYPDHVFWPTHGAPITDPAPYLRALIDHRRARQRQLLDELAHGPATADALVARIYAGIDPVLQRPARASLMAGIHFALQQGQVEALDDPADHYRLTNA